MAPRIVVMAGGTGGHVFPALAVAQELRQRGWEVSWLGTPDSFESRSVPEHGFQLDTIEAYRLRGQGMAGLLLAPFRLFKAMGQARAVLTRRQPDVVLGLGGFVTGPGGLMCKLMGVPLVIHEQNTIPGLANRWLARLAARVLQAFPGSFPDSAEARVTGNPVREDIVALPEPADRFTAHDGATHILIVGGSLGAQALNEIVPQALALVSRDHVLEIRHQAGRGKTGVAQDLYDELKLPARVTEFMDNMAQAYAWADLVICRAGALTVSELAAVGVGSILVPYPHAVDDHQTRNAGYLVQENAAVLMPQEQLDARSLAHKLRELLLEPGKLLAMAVAARKQAMPDAASRVADYCEQVVMP